MSAVDETDLGTPRVEADVQVTVPATVQGGASLAASVRVRNLTGHKLPTGYAEGRRMWLTVEARDGNGTKFWESGAYNLATGVLTQDPAIKIYRAEQAKRQAAMKKKISRG